jgi:hypothetical protein
MTLSLLVVRVSTKIPGSRCATCGTTGNLFQVQLADRMGCPRPYLTKVENGYVVPTIASLRNSSRRSTSGSACSSAMPSCWLSGRIIPEAVFTANGNQRLCP